MKGSVVANIKLDPSKQKLVECDVCQQPLVVGKFAKKTQTCETAGYYPSACPNKGKTPQKQKSARDKINSTKSTQNKKTAKKVSSSKKQEPKPVNNAFAAEFTNMMNELGFEIDSNRRYKKRYAVDGGGVITVYPHVERGVAGQPPKLEYFSVIMQRAVGVNEEFRRFLSPDIASDCEVLASEFGSQSIVRPEVGMSKCEMCGAVTDQVGIRGNKAYCITPSNCFKKVFTNSGAQSAD